MKKSDLLNLIDLCKKQIESARDIILSDCYRAQALLLSREIMSAEIDAYCFYDMIFSFLYFGETTEKIIEILILLDFEIM